MEDRICALFHFYREDFSSFSRSPLSHSSASRRALSREEAASLALLGGAVPLVEAAEAVEVASEGAAAGAAVGVAAGAAAGQKEGSLVEARVAAQRHLHLHGAREGERLVDERGAQQAQNHLGSILDFARRVRGKADVKEHRQRDGRRSPIGVGVGDALHRPVTTEGDVTGRAGPLAFILPLAISIHRAITHRAWGSGTFTS